LICTQMRKKCTRTSRQTEHLKDSHFT